ncbi:carbamoyltransferase C-terminal domain-containing protein [Bacillus thuringiensis]|uniref:carbamoyltransferase C-terminal domain-containing protein n=1 Tax=Bacillus tropicus TaxID=2026188 RepID=UPI0035D6A53E
MKDGYYLSTYLHVGDIHHLLKINARHDHNMSLWYKNKDNIELVHYWELERLTGLKAHDLSFYDISQAQGVINKLLSEYNLSLEDINEVWGTPGLDTVNDYDSTKVYTELSYHSIAHVFSAVMMDTTKFYNENIICLAVDGEPDGVVDYDFPKKNYYTGCVVRKGEIVEMLPVSSPGLLWVLAKHHYKLREGTLMALGSASRSEVYLEEEILSLKDGKSLPTAHDYVKKLAEYIDSLTVDDQGKKFNYFDPRFTIEENKISMAVKQIDKMSKHIMEESIDIILSKYNLNPTDTYLALSGGFGLNCPTNSYLMQKYGFKGFIAPPCISDTGISLGIALYSFYKKMSKVNFKLKNAFYGDKDDRLNAVLEKENFIPFIKSISKFDLNQAVEDIKNSPIVWFNGAAEIGPRALGNRSILADPSQERMKDILNKVKKREWWRPVAPIVLEEDLEEWFEGTDPSPFMLRTYKIKESKLELIPSVAHLDNSARVQTVNEEDNSLLYELIYHFKKKTRIPMLCNTSLNDKGEPIINSIEGAINFALKKGLQVVYINGMRIELHNHNSYVSDNERYRSISLELFSEEEKTELVKEANPFDLDRDKILFYLNNKHEFSIDITKHEDVKKLTKYFKLLMSKYGISSFDELYD